MTDPLAKTLLADEPHSSAPVVLGARYEIIAMLGAGGMGNVYRAHDRELDEEVAIKVLHPQIAAAPGSLERFRREVKLARRVTHPNVARVFDIGEHGDEKIITMELVDGESLSSLLERERVLPSARAIDITCAICAGVSAAHAAGVVHRDLKPDNVLLAKDGRVVVTDFGIARAVSHASDDAKTMGGFVGTPAYVAPEQVEGTAVDHRADVYALGEILYEMLVGDRPWQGETAMAVAAARLLRPPPDPRVGAPSVPPKLAEIVLRCMARSPSDRFQSMGEVTSALTALTTVDAGGSPPRSPSQFPRAAGAKRAAVLPFRNLGAPGDQHIADGLTDDLIDVLSLARGLRVTARGVIMRYKGTDRDPREIGRELDVQTVVDGSVRRAPGSVRITARLVSVLDGFQLWTKRFDGKEADVLVLGDDVARAIASALTVELDVGQREAADTESVDLYLRARAAYQAYLTHGPAEAIGLFEKALARSPDDPRVIAGYVIAKARDMRDAAAVHSLRAEAERAVRVAPSLPDAHVALASVLHQSNEPASAVPHLLRALRLSPNHVEAHDMLGRILLETRVKAGLRHVELALALEPRSTMLRATLARHLVFNGDETRTDELLEPNEPFRARLFMWRGDAEGAKRMLAQTAHVHTAPLEMVRVLLAVTADGTMINHEEWLRAYAALGQASPRARAFMEQLETEYACACGDAKRACDALLRGDAAGLFDRAWLEQCPVLASIRETNEYATVARHVAARAEAVAAAYVMT